MTRFIFPLLLVASAVGLFALYTNPTYQGQGGVKALKAQAQAYDDALNKSQELKKTRDEKLSRFNTFSKSDTERLTDFLPDNVDNIRLVIDINNVAARHSLSIKNLQIGDTQSGKNAQAAAAVGAPGLAVGSVDLGFTVTSDYDRFLAFLNDLEHSLRLVDIQKITFTSEGNKPGDYALSIRTYWLH